MRKSKWAPLMRCRNQVRLRAAAGHAILRAAHEVSRHRVACVAIWMASVGGRPALATITGNGQTLGSTEAGETSASPNGIFTFPYGAPRL